MLKDPPKVLKTGSADEYTEDRPYDLDPTSFARLEASFKLAAHYENVGFSELTAEMMSGDRIDEFIEQLAAHESVCQEAKESVLTGSPSLFYARIRQKVVASTSKYCWTLRITSRRPRDTSKSLSRCSCATSQIQHVRPWRQTRSWARAARRSPKSITNSAPTLRRARQANACFVRYSRGPS